MMTAPTLVLEILSIHCHTFVVVRKNIENSDTKELDGNEQPHIISKSYYNYNHIKYNIHENSKLVVQIITKLNENFMVAKINSASLKTYHSNSLFWFFPSLNRK